MNQKPTRRRIAFRLVMILVALLIYALSIGPAMWTAANLLPPPAAGIVILPYAPLILTAKATRTKDLLQAYVHLWDSNLQISLMDSD